MLPPLRGLPGGEALAWLLAGVWLTFLGLPAGEGVRLPEGDLVLALLLARLLLLLLLEPELLSESELGDDP